MWLTSTHLAVADLGPDFRPRPAPVRIDLPDIRAVERRDGRRLWKAVSDLRFVLEPGQHLDVRGFFAEEADELLEMIERQGHGTLGDEHLTASR